MIFVIPFGNIVDLQSVGTLAKTFGLGVAAFWMATVVATGRIRKPHILHIMVVVFLLWNALSIFWTVGVDETLSRVITYVQLFGLIYILWDLYTTPGAIWAGMQAYILGAYVSIASVASNFFTGNESSYLRYSATGFDSGDLGIFLAIGIPMAWYLAVTDNDSRKNRLLKLVNYAYTPLAIFAIILTAGRGTILATIPAAIFILMSLKRFNKWLRVAIFIGFLGVLFTLPTIIPETSFNRLATLTSELSEGSLSGRRYIWQEGLAVFAKHPVLGVGSGAFRQGVEVSFLNERKVAHNTYLSVLVEVGIPGFALLAAILAITVQQILRQPEWDSRLWLAVFLVWAIGAFALTFEDKKATWFVIGLIVASANLIYQSHAAEPYASKGISTGKVLLSHSELR